MRPPPAIPLPGSVVVRESSAVGDCCCGGLRLPQSPIHKLCSVQAFLAKSLSTSASFDIWGSRILLRPKRATAAVLVAWLPACVDMNWFEERSPHHEKSVDSGRSQICFVNFTWHLQRLCILIAYYTNVEISHINWSRFVKVNEYPCQLAIDQTVVMQFITPLQPTVSRAITSK